jgi:hypothetical protein
MIIYTKSGYQVRVVNSASISTLLTFLDSTYDVIISQHNFSS